MIFKESWTMRRSVSLIVVAILMAGLLIAGSSIGRAGAGGAPTRWEYRVVEGTVNYNDLGADGWELVAVYPGFKTGVYAYFKRPRRWAKLEFHPMTAKHKYILVVIVGWLVPMTCVVFGKGALAFGLAAVSIAWWHGYMAGKLESKIEIENSQGPGDTRSVGQAPRAWICFALIPGAGPLL
jgi:hypothetical protein